jgi:hypothetical protein
MKSKTMVINFDVLQYVKERYQQGAQDAVSAVDHLIREADEQLARGPFSVMQKKTVPPSGNRHDYMSLHLFSWPNPDSPNGMPYLRRDGIRNPDYKKFDRVPLGDLCTAVKTLGLAYFLTGIASYGAYASRLIKVWFLDESTRMNPNLNFASYAPGRQINQDGSGIIGSLNFTRLLDAVGFLDGHPDWSTDHKRQLQTWFSAYREWMLTGRSGMTDRMLKNNLGLWYDVQVLVYSLFVGDDSFVKQYAETTSRSRIAQQIESSGQMTHETVRALGLGYTEYSLNALLDLATLAQHAGIDLFNYQTSDGRGIRKALDWAIPYFLKPLSWPYQQIDEFQPGKCVPHLYRFARAYHDPSLIETAKKLQGWEKNSAHTIIAHCQGEDVYPVK